MWWWGGGWGGAHWADMRAVWPERRHMWDACVGHWRRAEACCWRTCEGRLCLSRCHVHRQRIAAEEQRRLFDGPAALLQCDERGFDVASLTGEGWWMRHC